MDQKNQQSNENLKASDLPENEKSNVEKNPDDWITGGEPMTGAQRS